MDVNMIMKASTSLSSKLEQQPKELPKCTIYRVHKHLRDVNPSAYEPEIMAIGPYHCHMDRLKMMEYHKLRSLQLLIERKGCDDITEYAQVVGGLEPIARKCYADQDFNLNESEFLEMLVLDGCFIIELVRKFHCAQFREKDDPIFKMEWMLCSLQRDLMLFENQLPFLVLDKLFDLIKDPTEDCSLIHLLSNFFSSLYPGKGCLEEPYEDGGEIEHLLDLIHRHWLPPFRSAFVVNLSGIPVRPRIGNLSPVRESSNGNLSTRIRCFSQVPVRMRKLSRVEGEKEFQFIYRATGLKEANVRFEMKEAATMFNVEFKDGVMMMTPLRVEDVTECFLRNLIAYEQYSKQSPHNFVTHYMKFLDSLIDSAEDVGILSRNGIITNWQGDDEVVAKMVNRLGDAVACPEDDFIYGEVFDDMNEHRRKPRNRWMAKLRRDYLHSPWAIISIIVALLLLLLTLLQTIFSMLQLLQNK